MPRTELHVTGDPEADELLSRDPLALLVGMVLDQQVTMEKAFSSPAELARRLGTPGSLDAATIAAMDPDDLVALFRERPALHRYPGSMATRVQDVSRVVAEEYGGRADAIWSGVRTGGDLMGRLRALPVVVCLAISVAGLLLYLNLVFEARHSWSLVIPTPGSLSRLWDLAGSGFTDSRRYAPPAPERAGLVLLAAGGIGITAVLTDLIAVRLRSAALAGLPLLVLFTVPITMNAQHEGFGTAVVFCLGTAGYLAMLSADGRERIRVWGRLVSLWRSGSLYDAAVSRWARADGGAGYVVDADPGQMELRGGHLIRAFADQGERRAPGDDPA